MARRYVRIGSLKNIQLYDDELFDAAVETDHTIKVGTPPASPNDVLRFDDIDLTILNRVYPIGSIYLTISDISPATSIGIGTWVRVASGKFLLGEGPGYTPAESTGGSMYHTHSVDPGSASTGSASPGTSSPSSTTEVASGTGATVASSGHSHTVNSHSHTVDISSTVSGNNNNVPPYYVVYVWKRTA
jgi:hypothetical protein